MCLQAHYRDWNQLTYARSVLVIHNMAHQGRGPLAEVSGLEIPEHYVDLFRLYDPIGGEHMNIFKAGLTTAHRIVAVSHGCVFLRGRACHVSCCRLPSVSLTILHRAPCVVVCSPCVTWPGLFCMATACPHGSQAHLYTHNCLLNR